MLGQILRARSIPILIPSHILPKKKYTLSIPYIEETEVLNILFSLKNSAAGYDGIPGSIMKTVCPAISR